MSRQPSSENFTGYSIDYGFVVSLEFEWRMEFLGQKHEYSVNWTFWIAPKCKSVSVWVNCVFPVMARDL